MILEVYSRFHIVVLYRYPFSIFAERSRYELASAEYRTGKIFDALSNYRLYQENYPKYPCNLVKVDEPRNVDKVMDAFYGIHGTMEGDVRFVFESLTGMQDLWELF